MCRRWSLLLLLPIGICVVLLGDARAATRSTFPYLVAASPDGKHIAWADSLDWQVWIANEDGTNPHPAGAPFADGVGQLTWTRYGLLVDSNYTLTLVARTGKRVKIGVVGDQQFSVGGAHAASGTIGCNYCHGPVSVYNIRTHTVVRLGDPKQENGGAALSPDGSHVVYFSPHGLVLQSASDGRAQPIHGGTCNISWSPNGRTLAFGSTGIAIEPATGGPLRTLIAPSHGFACTNAVPAWSPDSTKIAFVRLSGGSGNTQPRTQLAVIDLASHALRLTMKTLGDVTSYAWSPDGKSLFASFRTGDCGTVWKLNAATLSGTAVYRGCA